MDQITHATKTQNLILLSMKKSFEGIDDSKLSAINYDKMDSIAMVDYPIVPLAYDQVIRFMDKGVSEIKNYCN